MSDTTHSIARSATRFFSGTMLSRLTGMFRDMAMAYAFGTQSSVAALMVAFRFAHLLRRLLGEGAMQTAFIPHFETLRKENPQRAAVFFSDLSLTLTYLLLVIIAITMGGLGLLLSLNWLNEGNAEIAWLTLLMMPSLLFICLFGINASLLQCEKSYFIPSAAPIIFNLFWILGVFATQHLPPVTAMSYFCFFIIIACMAQWMITIPKTNSLLVAYERGSSQKATFFSFDVARLAKPLTLGIIGVAASQINNALDAVFARWASVEGPALLWYAIRLQQLPLALFGIAIAGALLPPLSRASKANDEVQFTKLLDFSLQRTFVLMMPITLLLFLVGDLCVAFIYGHGDFTNASIVGTTKALWGYTIGLIPMAFILLLAPAFYAKGNYRVPSLAAAASMLLNIFLNTWFVAGLDLGAASIAFATSLSAWFNLIWLGVALAKFSQLGKQWVSKELINHGIKIVLASLIAACVLLVSDYIFFDGPKAFDSLKGLVPEYKVSFFQQMMHLGALSVIFIGAYSFNLFLFKIPLKSSKT